MNQNSNWQRLQLKYQKMCFCKYVSDSYFAHCAHTLVIIQKSTHLTTVYKVGNVLEQTVRNRLDTMENFIHKTTEVAVSQVRKYSTLSRPDDIIPTWHHDLTKSWPYDIIPSWHFEITMSFPYDIVTSWHYRYFMTIWPRDIILYDNVTS